MSQDHPPPPSEPGSTAPKANERGLAFLSATSRTSSRESSRSLRSPRTPRFAEATTVHSPIEPSQLGRSPFADPPGLMTNHYQPQPQPSDVGFGYISKADPSRDSSYPGMPVEEDMPLPPKSPLKSALRVPGTPGRQMENPLSPTFQEEQILEKREEETDKENAKDLKVKIRVRMAKLVLRGVNFSCSLIVLSMLASTFAIFRATRHLPPRNTLPAWAPTTVIWPQVTLLTISCISLLFSIIVIGSFLRNGHRRAEKVAVYYTVFAVAFFAFSVIMWAVGAGILNHSKNINGGNDIWGWSCKDNKRRNLFQKDVQYALICRLQNWSLVCCIIEVVVEVLTITIYAVVFYRYWSKRRLRKTMDLRDKARSDLYLAQLRTQSAPNTPGFGGPMSPRFGPRLTEEDMYSQAEKGDNSSTQFATQSPSQSKPFKLQPPPIRVLNATPKPSSDGFDGVAPPLHSPAAPGERQFDAVLIPGSYASPLATSSFAPEHNSITPSPPGQAMNPLPGQAMTSEDRIDAL